MPRKKAPLSAEVIERIGKAYCDREISIADICRRFNTSPTDVVQFARLYGWPQRGRGSKPKHRSILKTRQPRPYRGAAEWAADQRAEEEKRQANLYGLQVDDVALLRRRGYGVTREGAGVRIGNQLCTFAQLREKADRERRLEAAARPVDTPAPVKPKRGRPVGYRESAATKAKRRATIAAKKKGATK